VARRRPPERRTAHRPGVRGRDDHGPNPGGPPEGAGYGYLTWVADGWFFAGGWAGQHVIVVPSARAVIVTTGDPQFDPGPPPTDRLPPDWRVAKELIAQRLLPLLR
jgi:CubicO group peptidase (beta-lactamase class C family)